MRFTTALAILASAGFAAAQTTSAAVATATGKCAAQNIVNACVTSINAQISNCSANDWICLCQQYTNLLTCYNNCPGQAEGVTVQNEVTSYCQAAAPLLSASSAAEATKSHASTSASTAAATAGNTMAMTAAASGATGSATGTAATASASSKGGAGAVVVPIGGLTAVFLGLVGLL